jgi:hypothetical protein
MSKIIACIDGSLVTNTVCDYAAWFNILSRISEGKYKGFIGMLYTTKYDIDGTELGIKARWIGDGKHQEQLISG